MTDSTNNRPVDAGRAILSHIGVDPDSDRLASVAGSLPTAERMIKALEELCETTFKKSEPPYMRVFDAEVDVNAMVVVRGIPFVSVCEHHLMPFTGTMDVGYVPQKIVLGLSKLPRLVKYYAAQPNMQERLTSQVANHILNDVQCFGIGVRCTARHSCMELRGARATGSETVTTTLLGTFRDSVVRYEFFDSLR